MVGRMAVKASQEQGVASEQMREAHKPIVLAPPPVTAETRRKILRRYGRRDMHFVSARSVRLLVDAAEAFPDMPAAIDGAISHVELETYILRPGQRDGYAKNFWPAACASLNGPSA